MLSELTAGLVGLVLLAAGLIKANDPQPLTLHLIDLRVLPRRLVKPLVGLFILVECLLGAGLLAGLALQWLAFAALVMLVGLTGLTWWSTATGRATDCGCYNGLLRLTPRQSMLVNAGLCGLLAISLWLAGPPRDLATWQLVVVGVTALVTAGLSLYFLAFQRPLIDLNPLKVGHAWSPDWLAGAEEQFDTGTWIVVFLEADCPLCKSWIKVLGVAHRRADLPGVVGVVKQAQAAAIQEASRPQFPLVDVPPADWRRLVFAIPCVVVLDQGVVREKWSRRMPAEFVARLKGPPQAVAESPPARP